MCCRKKTFTDSIASCSDVVKVHAIFEPLSTHLWVIIDPYGNNYEQEFTADESGYGSINLMLLPEGFCNPYLPGFTLKVKTDSASYEFEPLIFAVNFESADVSFLKGISTKNTIGSDTIKSTPNYILPTKIKFEVTETDDIFQDVRLQNASLVDVFIDGVHIDSGLIDANMNVGAGWINFAFRGGLAIGEKINILVFKNPFANQTIVSGDDGLVVSDDEGTIVTE